MSPKAPSIQSFFQPENPAQTSPKASTASQAKVGDGFTAYEVEATLHPLMRKWQPRTVYNEVNIGDLVAGPGSVTVTGRVVNLYAQAMTSKVPQAAKGCVKLVVGDDSGAFNVSERQCLCVTTKADDDRRSSFGTQRWTTPSCLAFSSLSGRRMCQKSNLTRALSRHRQVRSSLRSSPRETRAAISWCRTVAMRVYCARHHWATRTTSSWPDSSR